jgi:DNA-binding response OmpR family regulator
VINVPAIFAPNGATDGNGTRLGAGIGARAEGCTATILVLSRDFAFVSTHLRAVADDRTRVATCRDWSTDGRDGNGMADPPDVVVIDAASLHDGMLQLRRARRRWRTASILVANAFDEAHCGQYIDEGADDACVVGSLMLRTRLQALARRARALNGDLRIALGDLVIDREHRRAWCAARPIDLTPREFDLLLVLFERAPDAVEKDQIAAAVWGDDRSRSANTIEVYIGYLRRKLERSACLELRTQRNHGYALTYRDARKR